MLSESAPPPRSDNPKTKLRSAARAHRADCTSPAIARRDAPRLAAFSKTLLALTALPPENQLILSFSSLPHEPPMQSLNAALRSAGARVLIPVLQPDKDLDWVDDAHRAGPTWGCKAPRAAHLALIPALAIDRRGVRLGQGGGSYDRALPRLPDRAARIAVMHPGEVLEGALPAEPHDIPVDAVLTAARLQWLTGRLANAPQSGATRRTGE